MKHKLACLGTVTLIVLCGCSPTVPLSKYEADKNNFRKSLFYGIKGDASTTLGILHEFRADKPEIGIELLEFELDNNVSLLCNSLDRMDDATRDSSIRILRKIKEYREKHPRVVVGSSGNQELDEMVRKAKEDAVEILNKM